MFFYFFGYLLCFINCGPSGVKNENVYLCALRPLASGERLIVPAALARNTSSSTPLTVAPRESTVEIIVQNFNIAALGQINALLREQQQRYVAELPTRYQQRSFDDALREFVDIQRRGLPAGQSGPLYRLQDAPTAEELRRIASVDGKPFNGEIHVFHARSTNHWFIWLVQLGNERCVSKSDTSYYAELVRHDMVDVHAHNHPPEVQQVPLISDIPLTALRGPKCYLITAKGLLKYSADTLDTLDPYSSLLFGGPNLRMRGLEEEFYAKLGAAFGAMGKPFSFDSDTKDPETYAQIGHSGISGFKFDLFPWDNPDAITDDVRSGYPGILELIDSEIPQLRLRALSFILYDLFKTNEPHHVELYEEILRWLEHGDRSPEVRNIITKKLQSLPQILAAQARERMAAQRALLLATQQI